MKIKLSIENHLQDKIEMSLRSLWIKAAEKALSAESVLKHKTVELNLILCDNAEIREYNKEYRHVDRATDVLSFPMLDDFDELDILPDELPVIIGDIIISMERAKEQADEYGHSLQREAVFLFIHGVLHCMGYDHEQTEDEMEMRQRQRELLESLNLNLE